MPGKEEHVEQLIESKPRYHQAGAMVAFTGTYPMSACMGFTVHGRVSRLYYRDMVGYMQDDLSWWWFSRPNMEEVAKYYFEHNERSYTWIKELYRFWRSTLTLNLLRELKAQMNVDFSVISAQQLVRRHRLFSTTYLKWWKECIFLDAFDCAGESLLRRALGKYTSVLPKTAVDVLVSPKAASTLQIQRLDFLVLSRQFLSSKIESDLIHNSTFMRWSNRYPVHAKLLDKHSQKFYWIRGDYIHAPMHSAEDFFGDLKVLASNRKTLQAELRMEQEVKELSMKRNKLYKTYRLTREVRRRLDFFSTLVSWRDERKKYNIIACYLLLNKYLPELHRRTGLPISLLKHVYHWEFESVLDQPNVWQKMLLGRARGRFIVLKPNPNFIEFLGQSGKQLRDLAELHVRRGYSKIQGMTGYPGKARGIVKIIRSRNDFFKMHKGDILVTANTRPEFVPIMKQAAAIVTDEGGITSHAVIVARELKLPCIVGCQVGTSMLHDGDKVEVDATRGIVKKL